MITALRRQFKMSGYKIVLLILVAAIALGMVSIPGLFKSSDSGPWAIRINNNEIPYQHFVREVSIQRDRIAQFRAQYGQWADMLLQSMGVSVDPQALAFDSIVREELLQQFIDQIGIYLDHNYITEKIHDPSYVKQHLQEIIPSFLFENDTLNIVALNRYLQIRGLSMSAFEKKVEDIIARTLLLEILQTTLYVPNFDIKERYCIDTLKKSFTVATLSFEKALSDEKNKEISDKELKAFFDKENRLYKRYWVPEKRQGTTWKFDAKTYGITVSDSEIEHYYEDNKTKHYVDKQAQVRVKEIAQSDIETVLNEKNMTLEGVRSSLIDNPDSAWADKWKAVEPFSRGEKESTYERTAFLLRKEGDISQVIQTENGPVLLKLVKRIPRTYKSLSSVKDAIEKKVMQKKFKDAFARDMKQIMKDGVLSEDEFKAFVTEHAGKMEKTELLTEDESRVSQELFNLKEGKAHFYIQGNSGVAIQLDTIKQHYLPNLDSIKKEVESDLSEYRASEQLKKTLAQVSQELKARPFDEVVAQYKLTLDRITDVDPEDSKQIRSIDKRQLPASRMIEMSHVGALITHQTAQDAHLIRLDAVATIDDDQFKSTYKEIKNKLKGERMRSFMEGFVASLYRNATIETNESIILAGE